MPELGLEPDRESTRVHQLALRPFRGDLGAERMKDVYVADNGCQQPIYNIHDQPFPSCVGESLGAIIEAKVGCRISSTGIWRDARRRQGQIEILKGTRFEYAIESLMRRGWDLYESGEETNPDEMTKPDDLDSEMDAFDHRETELEHARIDIDWPADRILDAVDQALMAGIGVAFGIGVQPGYISYRAASRSEEKVIGTDWLSGDTSGHAQRIFAFRKLPGGERQYGVQGSWTENWGGMTSLTGQWQPGCCWIKSSVLLICWDLHVLKFKKI
jgi:hypothetical protein